MGGGLALPPVKSRVVLMRAEPSPSCNSPESITATVTPAPVCVVGTPGAAGLIETPPEDQSSTPVPVVAQLIVTEAAPGAMAPAPHTSPPAVPVFAFQS